jgi:RNA polymerase-associated protein LEO1
MVETSEVVADVLVPTWPRMTATDGKVWHVKLPAYVNVDPRPYDEEYYRQTNNDRDVPTGPAAKGKMIGVRNTLRWKWGKNADGEVERQSNARMVRWSDGSVSLQLGSDVFDLAPSYGATLARKQDESEDKKGAATPSAGRETTFVCVTAPNEQVLVTETSIAGQLSIVPTSMDSKTHRELVKHVGSQHEKQSRMMILDDLADHKKVQELLLRAAPQRQVAPKPSSRRSGARSTGDEFGSRRSRNFRRAASGDSEEEYETRRAREREYDEDDGFVVADSDEENEFKSKKRSKKSKKSSKRRHADYDDTEDEDEDDLDAMELADRRIEEAERDRKRSKKDSKKKSKDYLTSEEEDEDEPEDADRDDDDEDDADGDMDVESEEE